MNLNGATIREVVSKAKMHPQIACGIVFEVCAGACICVSIRSAVASFSIYDA